MREYIHFLIYDSHKHKFIKEHVITFKFPDKFNYLITLQSKCIPVYNGTPMIDGTLYEMIQLFIQPHIEINAVKLAKLHDASMLKDINYLIKNNFIYIKTEDLKFEKNDFNIAVQFDKYYAELVFATYPNYNDNVKSKRQNFKLEFIAPNKDKHKVEKQITSADTKYLTEKPKHVVTTKTIKTYTDANFKIEHGSIQAGSLVTISDMGHLSKGTPRLITQDQHYITANKDFVMPMKLEKKMVIFLKFQKN